LPVVIGAEGESSTIENGQGELEQPSLPKPPNAADHDGREEETEEPLTQSETVGDTGDESTLPQGGTSDGPGAENVGDDPTDQDQIADLAPDTDYGEDDYPGGSSRLQPENLL
jgi:hypothetical protein